MMMIQQRTRVERLPKSDYILFCFSCRLLLLLFFLIFLIRVKDIEGCLNGKNLSKIKRQANKTVNYIYIYINWQVQNQETMINLNCRLVSFVVVMFVFSVFSFFMLLVFSCFQFMMGGVVKSSIN